MIMMTIRICKDSARIPITISKAIHMIRFMAALSSFKLVLMLQTSLGMLATAGSINTNLSERQSRLNIVKQSQEQIFTRRRLKFGSTSAIQSKGIDRPKRTSHVL